MADGNMKKYEEKYNTLIKKIEKPSNLREYSDCMDELNKMSLNDNIPKKIRDKAGEEHKRISREDPRKALDAHIKVADTLKELESELSNITGEARIKAKKQLSSVAANISKAVTMFEKSKKEFEKSEKEIKKLFESLAKDDYGDIGKRIKSFIKEATSLKEATASLRDVLNGTKI